MFIYFLLILLFVINVAMLANRVKEERVDLLCIMIAGISMIGVVELIAGVLNIFGCMINSGICVAIYCIIAIGMFLTSKEKVKLEISISGYEVMFVSVITVVFTLVSIHMFGMYMRWTYYNSDPAVHFMNAMGIYREKKLNGMYFTSLLNSGIIDLFSYFLDEVRFYKAYIFGDICLNYFESIFFFACMYKQIKDRNGKLFLPISYILFILGYPMFSYVVGGYNYWGVGAVLCIYVIYWLNRYEKEKENRKWILFFISLGCFCVSICYMMFVPFVYITSFIVLLRTYIGGKNIFKIKEYVFLNLKVFLLPTILTLYYCFIVFFKGNISTILNVVNVDAGVIDLFDSFLFLIPLLAMYILNKMKTKNVDVYDVSAIVLLVNIVLFFVLGICDFISPYYFNKLNYPLWCLIWIMLCNLFRNLNKETMIYYIYLIIVSIGSICLLEEKTRNTEEGYIIKNEIEMYSTNMDYLVNKEWGENFLSKYKRELYSYVIDVIDESVVMLADMGQTYNVYFYEAITGEQSAQYCWYCEDDDESFQKIQEDNISYIIVLKESSFFEKNIDKLEKFDVVKENEIGCIYYAK